MKIQIEVDLNDRQSIYNAYTFLKKIHRDSSPDVKYKPTKYNDDSPDPFGKTE